MRPLDMPPVAAIVRTDYRDDEAWRLMTEHVRAESDEGFTASVDFVEDRRLDGLAVGEVLAMLPPDDVRFFLFVADAVTLRSPDGPLLVVDLHRPASRPPFRAARSAVQSIENNLSLFNMDFWEFADNVDDDGVFRGF